MQVSECPRAAGRAAWMQAVIESEERELVDFMDDGEIRPVDVLASEVRYPADKATRSEVATAEVCTCARICAQRGC